MIYSNIRVSDLYLNFNYHNTEGVYFIMNKTILLFVVLALFSLNLAALDITTTKGIVYKNVEVTNVLPDAVGFIYVKKDGTEVLRDVELSLLTKDLQKKFNYSPPKAKKFKKHVAKFQADRAKLLQKTQSTRPCPIQKTCKNERRTKSDKSSSSSPPG